MTSKNFYDVQNSQPIPTNFQAHAKRAQNRPYGPFQGRPYPALEGNGVPALLHPDQQVEAECGPLGPREGVSIASAAAGAERGDNPHG